MKLKYLLLFLLFPFFLFGETTWTATWNATTDNKGVEGYILNIYSNDVLVNSFDVGAVLSYQFTNEDSICGTVQAYDEAGNVSDASDVVCVQTLKGTFDIDADGKVNKKDADLWLETYPENEFPYNSLYDVNADGKVYYDDLYVLNVQIYDLTGGGMVTGADELEWQRRWNVDPDDLSLDIDGNGFVTGKDRLDLINYIIKE